MIVIPLLRGAAVAGGRGRVRGGEDTCEAWIFTGEYISEDN